MTDMARKWNRVLLSVLLVCLLFTMTAVRAAPSCALQVTILDEADKPVPNINVDLYQVAVTANGTTALTADFSGLSLSADQLLADNGAQNANLVYQYVFAQEPEYMAKRHTNSGGAVNFSGLQEGIYLVLDEGGQKVSFQPYLVVLPTRIDGQLIYRVSSIPKTSQTDTKSFLVVMLWEDNMNAAGKRPNSVDVTLLGDGQPLRKITLSADNSWQHQFYQLPPCDEYAVQAQAVPKYTTTYDLRGDSCIIINRYTGGGGGGGGVTPDPPSPTTAHVSVYKVWDDNDNAAGKRPDRVTVQLISGGTVIKTATLSQANSWGHTFSGLDPARSYTVQETAVDGYAPDYSGSAASGITITNRYHTQPDPPVNPDPPRPVEPIPQTIDIPVNVVWAGDEDASQVRPNLVTVHLIAAGSIVSTVHIGPDDQWRSVFSGVPADLAYSVLEETVDGYSSSYSGSAAQGFTVINTYRSENEPAPPLPPQPPEPPPYEPSVPAGPSQPTIPQTGAQLWPLGLLLAAGVLLVVLGIADLRRGRKKP